MFTVNDIENNKTNIITRARGEDLTHIAARSSLWVGISTVVVGILRFLTIAILAHYLIPEDFGLIGMAAIVTEVIHLFSNLGVGSAIIQKKDITPLHLSTTFWVNLLVGIGLCGLTIAISPYAAMFFHNEMVKPITIVLSFNFIIGALGSVHNTLLTKEIKFNKIAFINISGIITYAGVSIILAVRGYGVWSMVIGLLFSRVVETCCSWSSCQWHPSFNFSLAYFKPLFKFGRNLLGQDILNYFSKNMDYIIAGRILGASLLGYYRFAYIIPHTVHAYLSPAIAGISYPLYCQVQDDNERMRRGYLKTITFMSMIIFPFSIGLFAVAPEFIPVIFGEKWLPVIAPLRILCFSCMVKSILTMGSPILNSKGRPDIGLKWNLFMLPMTIIALLIGSRWGIVGIAWAMTLVVCLSVIIIKITISLINLKFRYYLKALYPALSSSLVMLIFIQLFRIFFYQQMYSSKILLLMISIAIGVITYVGFVKIVWVQSFNELKDFVKKSIRNN